jgi:hypothetical protein
MAVRRLAGLCQNCRSPERKLLVSCGLWFLFVSVGAGVLQAADILFIFASTDLPNCQIGEMQLGLPLIIGMAMEDRLRFAFENRNSYEKSIIYYRKHSNVCMLRNGR